MSSNSVTLVIKAAERPITLAEAKQYLRVFHNSEDDLILRLLDAATSWVERETRRALVDSKWLMAMDRFPQAGGILVNRGQTEDVFIADLRGSQHSFRAFQPSRRSRAIALPKGKAIAVDKIDFTDTANVVQTLTGPSAPTPGTDYQEDLTSDLYGLLMPPESGAWPGNVNVNIANNVQITFRAGYGKAADVPDDLNFAVMFRLADYFNVRDTTDAGNRTKWFDAAKDIAAMHTVNVL